MLPAEKTHYRKGLALGLTMAETFSIIVFILLLVCAVLLIGVNDAKEVAEGNLKEERVDHAFTRHTLESMAPSGINTDAWLRRSRQLSDSLRHAQDRIETLEADSLRRRAEIETLQQMLANIDQPDEVKNELAEFAEQTGQVAALKDSLAQAGDAIQELERQRESLNEELQEAQQIGETVRKAIARRQGMDPDPDAERETLQEPPRADDLSAPPSGPLADSPADPLADPLSNPLADSLADDMVRQATRTDRLADSLEVARDVIASLETGQAMWDSLANVSSTDPDALRATAARERMRASSMQDRLAARERERDEAIDRAEFREAEVRRLRGGLGIDPPPCWLDAENNPEYMFRVVLTDNGLRLFDITPSHRRNDPAMQYLSVIEDGRTYTSGEFFELTRPIYDESLSRTTSFGATGCRFWVRPEDGTGARKDIFRQRERQLGRHFWFRW